MRVVDMCEDPEQLTVQVLTSESVVFGKIVGSRREGGWIIEKVLSPSEDKVDVDRCRKLNWLAVGIYPCIVKPVRDRNVSSPVSAWRSGPAPGLLTYRGPAAIVGHSSGVQNSDMTP